MAAARSEHARLASTTMTSKSKKRWEDEVDDELKPLLRKLPSNTTWTLWKAGLVNFAYRITPLIGPLESPFTSSGDVTVESLRVGKYFRPRNESQDHNLKGSGAILWMHGGGRILGSPKMDASICTRLVRELGVSVLSVEYRLAPRNPFPAALDDCVAAWEWLRLHGSGGSGIDRIIVGGESAGGGLAAELCQRLYDESKESVRGDAAADRKQVPLAQVLVYPMLDDRTVLDNDKTERRHLIWNNASNKIGWTSYLGPNHKPGDKDLPKYCAAARRGDLSGLPPAWIMVGTLDLFYEEDCAYASGLEAAGVDAQLVEVEGAFHGFFYVERNEAPIVQNWNDMVRFIRQHLEQKQ